MKKALSASEIARKIEGKFPKAIIEFSPRGLVVDKESLLEVATYLKTAPELDFDYLNMITCVDYLDYFEVVYLLTSLGRGHRLVLKTRCYQRESPSLPSVVGLWRGADFQEREIYDLFGVSFEGHPNLKRIVLWEGFAGHPLRKDYLEW